MPKGVYVRGEWSKRENCIGDLETQFWKRVDKDGPYPGKKGKWNLVDNCWIWIGSKLSDGYGQFRNRKAHRVCYEIVIGQIPENRIIMHKCDNPACVNPNHLHLGTNSENTIDMFEKGRKKIHGRQVSPPKGEINPKAKMKESQVIEARKMYNEGYTVREIKEILSLPVTLGNVKSAVKGETWRYLNE